VGAGTSVRVGVCVWVCGCVIVGTSTGVRVGACVWVWMCDCGCRYECACRCVCVGVWMCGCGCGYGYGCASRFDVFTANTYKSKLVFSHEETLACGCVFLRCALACGCVFFRFALACGCVVLLSALACGCVFLLCALACGCVFFRFALACGYVIFSHQETLACGCAHVVLVFPSPRDTGMWLCTRGDFSLTKRHWHAVVYTWCWFFSLTKRHWHAVVYTWCWFSSYQETLVYGCVHVVLVFLLPRDTGMRLCTRSAGFSLTKRHWHAVVRTWCWFFSYQETLACGCGYMVLVFSLTKRHWHAVVYTWCWLFPHQETLARGCVHVVLGMVSVPCKH